MTKVDTSWASRIVRSGTERPSELVANPLNYRRHPPHQHAALSDMLGEVGWVQQVVKNERTGHLVDGHLRVELALRRGDEPVPVLYVDLDEREERLVLAALDPIAALAQADGEALETLLSGLTFNGDDLADMLNELQVNSMPPPESPPRGESLDELDVSVADPVHEVGHGDTWRLGRHILHVGSVHRDWPNYVTYLVPGAVFAPYPTPMLPVLFDEAPLVMVQPDTYLAGHVLDKWASRHGEPEQL